MAQSNAKRKQKVKAKQQRARKVKAKPAPKSVAAIVSGADQWAANELLFFAVQDIEPPMHLLVAKQALSAGADVNAVGEKWLTPLHVASDETMTRFLLQHGADANARDVGNHRPLHTAINAEQAKLLLAAGVPVDAKSKIGRTALFYAKSEEIVDVLVSAGADVSGVDLEGEYADEVLWEWAALIPHADTQAAARRAAKKIQALRQHGGIDSETPLVERHRTRGGL